ncbi:MAG: hypothetical protein AAB787_02515 [Patescibacteria group bacterium]
MKTLLIGSYLVLTWVGFLIRTRDLQSMRKGERGIVISNSRSEVIVRLERSSKLLFFELSEVHWPYRQIPMVGQEVSRDGGGKYFLSKPSPD